MEIVDDESKITIDIAICSKVPQESYELTKNAANNWMRAREMRRHFNGMNAINWQKSAFPEADYRYLFY